MTSAAAVGGRERVSASRLLRREGHPLGVPRYYEDPADEAAEAAATTRKWTFGVAAGTLLVAGTFAAGALGLNGGTLPLEDAGEHATAAPGQGHSNSDSAGGGPNGQHDIGTPAVAAPPHDDHRESDRFAGQADRGGLAAGGQQAGNTDNTGGTGDSGRGEGGEHVAPAPAPAPPETPAQRSGPVEKVVKPVTDTVGDVAKPVTDTVGGVLSPVTGTLSGGGDQPAMTMIDPLGDLLGS
ncbi:MAG: hypothetical protein ACRDSK_16350 [Actinophytocola sp.]|uniref:hypothetical protein n=1 Tax=Actinophytocola sp. TaxID=1872138 RepID=UPI003D6A549E